MGGNKYINAANIIIDNNTRFASHKNFCLNKAVKLVKIIEIIEIIARLTTNRRLNAINNKFMPLGSYKRTANIIEPAIIPSNEAIITNFLREKLYIIPNIKAKAAK